MYNAMLLKTLLCSSVHFCPVEQCNVAEEVQEGAVRVEALKVNILVSMNCAS